MPPATTSEYLSGDSRFRRCILLTMVELVFATSASFSLVLPLVSFDPNEELFYRCRQMMTTGNLHSACPCNISNLFRCFSFFAVRLHGGQVHFFLLCILVAVKRCLPCLCFLCQSPKQFFTFKYHVNALGCCQASALHCYCLSTVIQGTYQLVTVSRVNHCMKLLPLFFSYDIGRK